MGRDGPPARRAVPLADELTAAAAAHWPDEPRETLRRAVLSGLSAGQPRPAEVDAALNEQARKR